MKNVSVTICFFFSLTIAHGQNLVPDGSFEQNTACPLAGNVNYNAYWINPTAGSPDYYDTCSNSWINSVPSNAMGSQSAFGGAYVGLITGFVSDFKEYVQVKLIDTLRAGKLYCVSYYVSLAGKSAYASNAPQAYFSQTAISSTSSTYFPYSPQITNLTIISDTLNWTYITGTFTASGGEQYLTIGNFYSDANTPKMAVNLFNGVFAYYYLDNVLVTQCDSLSGLNEQFLLATMNIFPNPFSTQTVLKTDISLINATLTVDNCFGQTVKQIKNINGKTIILQRDNLASGLYFVRLTVENKIISVDKLVITD